MPAPKGQPADHPAKEPNFDSYIADELRCMVLRLRLMANELNFIGVALTQKLITAGEALDELHALGALDHMACRERGTA
jgi:hypothetical protein